MTMLAGDKVNFFAHYEIDGEDDRTMFRMC